MKNLIYILLCFFAINAYGQNLTSETTIKKTAPPPPPSQGNTWIDWAGGLCFYPIKISGTYPFNSQSPTTDCTPGNKDYKFTFEFIKSTDGGISWGPAFEYQQSSFDSENSHWFSTDKPFGENLEYDKTYKVRIKRVDFYSNSCDPVVLAYNWSPEFQISSSGVWVSFDINDDVDFEDYPANGFIAITNLSEGYCLDQTENQPSYKIKVKRSFSGWNTGFSEIYNSGWISGTPVNNYGDASFNTILYNGSLINPSEYGISADCFNHSYYKVIIEVKSYYGTSTGSDSYNFRINKINSAIGSDIFGPGTITSCGLGTYTRFSISNTWQCDYDFINWTLIKTSGGPSALLQYGGSELNPNESNVLVPGCWSFYNGNYQITCDFSMNGVSASISKTFVVQVGGLSVLDDDDGDNTISVGNKATATSISEDEFELFVFPNPNKGEFSLHLTGDISESRYYIYNSLGNEIINNTLYNNIETIDISNYPEGIYLLKFVKGDKLITKTIVKN